MYKNLEVKVGGRLLEGAYFRELIYGIIVNAKGRSNGGDLGPRLHNLYDIL